MTSSVPTVLMRGGTSKGIFLLASDVPARGPALDRILLDLMGSPDAMQIDGLGGTHSSTSKAIIVSLGSGDIDISYWFAQVGIAEPIVDWSGNCGNLTTAVGVFAIEQGLIPARQPSTVVMLRNENTGVVIECVVPVVDGAVQVSGAARVAGVARPGAPILTSYLRPGGGVLGSMLATGSPMDEISVDGMRRAVSILDISHPYAIVSAEEIGIDITDAVPAVLNQDQDLLDELERIRRAAATLVAERCTTRFDPSPAVPRLLVVAAESRERGHGSGDIVAIGCSMGKVHHALPMTGALCLAGALGVVGSLPANVAGVISGRPVSIRHPKGLVEVQADVDVSTSPPTVDKVGIIRTARTLMSGLAFLHPESPSAASERPHSRTAS